MKQIFILIVLIISLNARDVVYLMPDDGNKAEKEISYLISHAHRTIDIAMYSFTNKVYLKALKLAARKGVQIRIVADKGSNSSQKHYSIVPQLRKLRNVHVHLLSGKRGRYGAGLMHIKLLIVDNKIVAFGSANYTYNAFHNNYELLYINYDYYFTKKFIPIFEKLWERRSRRRHAYDKEVSHFFHFFK